MCYSQMSYYQNTNYSLILYDVLMIYAFTYMGKIALLSLKKLIFRQSTNDIFISFHGIGILLLPTHMTI